MQTVQADALQLVVRLVYGLTIGLSIEHVWQVVSQQSASFGCKAEIDWVEDRQPYYPPLINDEAAYQFAVGVGQR